MSRSDWFQEEEDTPFPAAEFLSGEANDLDEDWEEEDDWEDDEDWEEGDEEEEEDWEDDEDDLF